MIDLDNLPPFFYAEINSRVELSLKSDNFAWKNADFMSCIYQ